MENMSKGFDFESDIQRNQLINVVSQPYAAEDRQRQTAKDLIGFKNLNPSRETVFKEDPKMFSD